MATVKNPKPFNIKGKTIVSFLGEAEWCKILPTQMETRFTPRGQYSVSVIGQPAAPDVLEFNEKLQVILDTAYEEAMADAGAMKLGAAKKKNLQVVSPISDHITKEKDDDGNYSIEVETGNIVIKPKMKNVLDRKAGQNLVKVVGENNQPIPANEMFEIGNGSKIKVKMYVNPYYMPTTNTIGVSLSLEAIKIYELVSYSSSGDGEDFDDDGGIPLDSNTTADIDKEDF